MIGGLKGAQAQADMGTSRWPLKKALLARFATTAGDGEMWRPGHR
jgi:hypothetical protein